MIRNSIYLVAAIFLMTGYLGTANAKHSCLKKQAKHWPKKTVSSTGAVLGGTGVIAAGATGPAGLKDRIRFICPAGTQSFEINLRNTANTNSLRAKHVFPVPSTVLAGNSGMNFGNFVTVNGAYTEWEVEIYKNYTSVTTSAKYELCVACWTESYGSYGNGTAKNPIHYSENPISAQNKENTPPCPYPAIGTCYVENN